MKYTVQQYPEFHSGFDKITYRKVNVGAFVPACSTYTCMPHVKLYTCAPLVRNVWFECLMHWRTAFGDRNRRLLVSWDNILEGFFCIRMTLVVMCETRSLVPMGIRWPWTWVTLPAECTRWASYLNALPPSPELHICNVVSRIRTHVPPADLGWTLSVPTRDYPA